MKYKNSLALLIVFIGLTIAIWRYSDQTFRDSLWTFGTWIYGLTALYAAYQISEEFKKNRILQNNNHNESKYTKLISLTEKLDFIVTPEAHELLNNIDEFRELLSQHKTNSSKALLQAANNFLSSLDDRLKLELNNIQDVEEKSSIINKFINAKRDLMHEIFNEQNRKHAIPKEERESLIGFKIYRVKNAEIISIIQNIIKKKSHIISHLSEARKNHDLNDLKYWVDMFNKSLKGTPGSPTIDMDEYGNLTISLRDDKKTDNETNASNVTPYKIVQFLNEGGINNIFGFEKALEIKKNLEHKIPHNEEHKLSPSWKDIII